MTNNAEILGKMRTEFRALYLSVNQALLSQEEDIL